MSSYHNRYRNYLFGKPIAQVDPYEVARYHENIKCLDDHHYEREHLKCDKCLRTWLPRLIQPEGRIMTPRVYTCPNCLSFRLLVYRKDGHGICHKVLGYYERISIFEYIHQDDPWKFYFNNHNSWNDQTAGPAQ